jgi:hypothetical protein
VEFLNPRVAKYGQVRAQNPNPFLVPPPLNPSFLPLIQLRFLSEVSRNPMPGIQFKVSRFEYWDFSVFSTAFLYIQSRSPDFCLKIFFPSQPLVASFFTFNENLQTWDFCLLNPFILSIQSKSLDLSLDFFLTSCLPNLPSLPLNQSLETFNSSCHSLDLSLCLKILSLGIFVVSCASQFCTRKAGELTQQRIIRCPVLLLLWCCCWKTTTLRSQRLLLWQFC